MDNLAQSVTPAVTPSDSYIHFLNIEYFFNVIFQVILWLRYEIFGPVEIRNAINASDTPLYTAEEWYFKMKGLGQSFTWTDFVASVKDFFSGSQSPAVTETPSQAGASLNAGDLFSSFQNLFSIIFLILVTIIMYSLVRWWETIRDQKKKVKEMHRKPEEITVSKNERWQIVLNHLNSGNPPEWRLAVLEADNILAEILENRGYQGEGIGEKLTNSNFNTIEDAWDAHKVRNRIAHEGVDFALTEHEARRVIALYERVFMEFNAI